MTQFLKLLVFEGLAENLHTCAIFCGCFKTPLWEITQSTVQPGFQETFTSWVMEYSHLLYLGCVHPGKSICTREWCLTSRPNPTYFYSHSHFSVDWVNIFFGLWIACLWLQEITACLLCSFGSVQGKHLE